MSKKLVPPITVAPERSGPFTITLTDGSYIQWDNQDGVFRIAYYGRKTARGKFFRETLAVAMKKQVWSKQINDILEYVEEREEYVAAVSSPKKMVQ